MRKLLLILLIFSTAQAQTPLNKLIRKKAATGGFVADSAQFTFSWNSPQVEPAVSGWTVLQPNPNASVLTASQNSYSISTVATGDSYWNDLGGPASAGYIEETTPNDPFPAGVSTGYFFHASTSYPTAPHLRITCPSANAYYDVYVMSNRPQSTDSRQSKIRCVTRYETRERTGVISAPNANASNDSTSQVTSGGTWVRFKNCRPDASGYIFVEVAAQATFTYGYVNAIKIVRREDL